MANKPLYKPVSSNTNLLEWKSMTYTFLIITLLILVVFPLDKSWQR